MIRIIRIQTVMVITVLALNGYLGAIAQCICLEKGKSLFEALHDSPRNNPGHCACQSFKISLFF